MATVTKLKPIDIDRARDIDRMLREVQDNPAKGLAIDEEGCINSVVNLNDSDASSLLGDFDVHA